MSHYVGKFCDWNRLYFYKQVCVSHFTQFLHHNLQPKVRDNFNHNISQSEEICDRKTSKIIQIWNEYWQTWRVKTIISEFWNKTLFCSAFYVLYWSLQATKYKKLYKRKRYRIRNRIIFYYRTFIITIDKQRKANTKFNKKSANFPRFFTINQYFPKICSPIRPLSWDNILSLWSLSPQHVKKKKHSRSTLLRRIKEVVLCVNLSEIVTNHITSHGHTKHRSECMLAGRKVHGEPGFTT